MVSGDGTDVTTGFLTQIGEATEHLYSVTFWHHEHAPSTGVFEDMLGMPPSLSQGMTYEATMLVVRAIREAGPTREAVLHYFTEENQAGRSLGRGASVNQPTDTTDRLLMLRAGVPISSLVAGELQKAGSAR
jgi:hypothetical protein